MKTSTSRRIAEFRFYEELNDFLPPDKRKRSFAHNFAGTPSVKDSIESIGVPHSEIDLILVNGESVDFKFRLEGGERVAVYPVFERFDISPLLRLRPRPLRNPRFILDVHLGKLARYLRLLGFDTLYRNDYEDATIIAISVAQQRIILTRDVGLLKHGSVTRGYWVRGTRPKRQLQEIIQVFYLNRCLAPFSRCIACNGELDSVAKETVLYRLPPRTREHFDEFYECRGCARIYWAGSHYDRMREWINDLLACPATNASADACQKIDPRSSTGPGKSEL